MRYKRGNINALSSYAIALLVLIMVVGVAGLVATQFRNSTLALVGGNSASEGVVLINQGIAGMGTLGSFIGIVVIVGVCSVLIYTVLRSFGGAGGKR